MAEPPSLLQGSPKDIANFLLQHRFENNAMTTVTFLMQTMDHIPNVEKISADLIQQGDEEANEEDNVKQKVDTISEEERKRQKNEEQIEYELELVGSILPLPLSSTHTVDGLSSSATVVTPNPIQSTGDATPPNNKLSEATIANVHAMKIEVNATTPRAKFHLSLHERGIILSKPPKQSTSQSSSSSFSPLQSSDMMIIPARRVQKIVMFPKPEDCCGPNYQRKRKKKSSRPTLDLPGSLILLLLRPPHNLTRHEPNSSICCWKSKPLHQICFQLPTHQSDPFTTEEYEEGDSLTLRNNCVDPWEERWRTALEESLGVVVGGGRAVNPRYHGKKSLVIGQGKRGFVFRSNDGEGGPRPSSAGMPFVKCYDGINYGVLFPLEDGLLFYKPPRFMHRNKLHSISCGRSSGGSRYIDLIATLDDVSETTKAKTDRTSSRNSDSDEMERDSKEFNSIDEGEKRVLNKYINIVLMEAMAKDTTEGSDVGLGDGSGNDHGSVLELDDGATTALKHEGGKNNGNDTSWRKGRSQRNASKEARRATKLQLQNSTDQEPNDDEEDDESVEYQEEHSEEDTVSSDDETEFASSDDDDNSVNEDQELENDTEETDDAYSNNSDHGKDLRPSRKKLKKK